MRAFPAPSSAWPRGASATSQGGESVLLTVAAGEDWDSVVAGAVADGLAGLECLAGIPGLTGATPIQNVGAYGQEVAETLVTVRAYDRDRREVVDLPAAECGFGYRTSAFKRSLTSGGGTRPGRPGPVTGRFVVLAVTFRLGRSALSAPVRYGELARALGVREGARAPLAEVRSAVLALRRGKGMVLDPADPDTRSAGSFFTNPVLDPAAFAALERVVAATFGPGSRCPGSWPARDASRSRRRGSSSGPASPRATRAALRRTGRGSRPSTPWRWSIPAARPRLACSPWPGRSPMACGRRSAWTWPPNPSWSARTSDRRHYPLSRLIVVVGTPATKGRQ